MHLARRSPTGGFIPSDLLRTLVLIADLGSVTGAARELGITQSAVSAQIRKLESAVAGAVFVKQGRGVQLSELGKLVLSYARRIVAMSDQLQVVLGVGGRKSPVRIGLPTGIDHESVSVIFKALSSALGNDPLITCDSTVNLLRQLDAGFVDAAFLVDLAPISASVAIAWTEPWHWIKAPQFLLSPGALVPLIGWPGRLSDRVAITALERAGVSYRTAFTSPDLSLRQAAVLAGIGLMATSYRSMKVSNLLIAREYYLPALPELHGGIYLSDSIDPKQRETVLGALESVLRPAGFE